MVSLFESISDPSRRAILAELIHGPKKVGDIVRATGLKQPNVSNHLAKLKKHRIVKSDKTGREVYYSIIDPDLVESVQGLLKPSKDRPFVILDPSTALDFARAATVGDTDRCEDTVSSLLRQGEPLVAIYAKVFAPALQFVDDWWVVRAIDESQEHLATSVIEQCMARVALFHEGHHRNGWKAVLGCSEGNHHTIGLRMLHDAMRTDGWQNFFLGADVPKEAFLSAIETHRPNVVLVSCSDDAKIDRFCELIEELVSHRRPEAHFYICAGGPAVQRRDDLIGNGVDYSADDILQFTEKTLTHLLERLQQHPVLG